MNFTSFCRVGVDLLEVVPNLLAKARIILDVIVIFALAEVLSFLIEDVLTFIE